MQLNELNLYHTAQEIPISLYKLRVLWIATPKSSERHVHSHSMRSEQFEKLSWNGRIDFGGKTSVTIRIVQSNKISPNYQISIIKQMHRLYDIKTQKCVQNIENIPSIESKWKP